jgi:hypothetical protein
MEPDFERAAGEQPEINVEIEVPGEAPEPGDTGMPEDAPTPDETTAEGKGARAGDIISIEPEAEPGSRYHTKIVHVCYPRHLLCDVPVELTPDEAAAAKRLRVNISLLPVPGAEPRQWSGTLIGCGTWGLGVRLDRLPGEPDPALDLLLGGEAGAEGETGAAEKPARDPAAPEDQAET